MTPRASVVVPTHGRPALLRECLRRLARQDVPHADYEVIVVDDGSPPPVNAENAAVVQRLSRSYPKLAIHYLWSARNRGPAAARNSGWRKARAAVIAFTDDDTRPARAWLRNGLAALEGREAVAGRIVVPLPDEPTDYERDTAGLERASFVTANAFVRKSVLESVGGFDERYRIAWREDADLEFALRERGARIGRAPGAVVVHPVRPARWGVSIAQQKKVVFDALLYKKHPRDYRASIRPVPPWDYYAATGALVGFVVALAQRNVPAAIVGALLWSAITANFCRRRLAGTRKSASHVLEMIATSALIPPVSVFWRLAGAWRWRVLFL